MKNYKKKRYIYLGLLAYDYAILRFFVHKLNFPNRWFQNLLDIDFSLREVWRMLEPKKENYTFQSPFNLILNFNFGLNKQ